MRAVNLCRLAWPCLLSACLSTQDVSLGELPRDVGDDASADVTQHGDAQTRTPEPHDADDDRTPHDADDADRDEDRSPDSGTASEAGADDASDADQSDAGVADTGVADTGAADASTTDASVADGSARDASSADAGDGNVPLICILEPWHCR